MDLRQKLALAGGGAVAALVLLGGAVMAQSPGGSPSPEPSTPPTTAPTNPGAPDTSPQPATPGQRGDRDCPDKGAGQGTAGTGQSPTSGRFQTSRQSPPAARF